jgi:replicative DNA helicase
MATLAKSTIAFQAQALSWILKDTSALAQVRGDLGYEFWQNPIHSKIVSIAYDYFDLYGGVPSEHTLRLLVDDSLMGESDLSEIAEYGSVIDLLYNELLKDDAEVEFLKANLENMIRKRLTELALVNSVSLSDEGLFDQISESVGKAASFRLDKDDRHIKWSKHDRTSYIPSPDSAPVPTMFGTIDEELHGGLRPGELGLVCGPPGTGKSQLLVNLAANAMWQGHKVLFITLEMGEESIAQRLDACISGIEYWGLSDPTINASAQSSLKEWHDEHQGDCDIRYFPQLSITVPQLKALIKKWYIADSFPGLIVVDYADLILPSVDYKSSYDNQGLVYGQLVATAGEFKIPIWSASQINREGTKSKVRQMEHLAESFKKAMVANVVYTVNQDENEQQSKMMRLYSAKVRNGEKNRFHYFKTEFHKSKLVPTSEEAYTALKQDPNYGGAQQPDLSKTAGLAGWSAAKMMNLLKTQ